MNRRRVAKTASIAEIGAREAAWTLIRNVRIAQLFAGRSALPLAAANLAGDAHTHAAPHTLDAELADLADDARDEVVGLESIAARSTDPEGGLATSTDAANAADPANATLTATATLAADAALASSAALTGAATLSGRTAVSSLTSGPAFAARGTRTASTTRAASPTRTASAARTTCTTKADIGRNQAGLAVLAANDVRAALPHAELPVDGPRTDRVVSALGRLEARRAVAELFRAGEEADGHHGNGRQQK